MEQEAVPDHLRCKRTDGRQWRCKRRVMDDDKAYCENHYRKYLVNTKKSASRKKNSEKEPVSRKINTEKRTVSSAICVKEEDIAVPDCLRCSKTDGRKWRCRRLVIDGDKYCEIHHARVKKVNSPKISVEEGEFVNERSNRRRISTEKVISMIEDESVKEHRRKRRISAEEDEFMQDHSQLRRISTKKVKSRKGKEEILPDHLRCNRRDGRQWRCYRPVFGNLKLCEIHHLQGQHRQNKQIVPESLKIQRKIRKTLDKPNASPNSKIRSKKSKKNRANLVKRRQWIAVSEALDEALKKMKLKKGDLQLELIRMFLQRQVERQKQRDSEAKSQGDLLMYLPNARLSISPSLSPLNFDNAGPFCDVKIGVDSNSIARRCFRSKNIEPLPIGPLKVVPFAKNVANLRRVKRKKCQLAGLAESEQVL